MSFRSRRKPLSEQDQAFVSDTAAALLQDTPRGARLLLWSIVLFLVCALSWAWYAQLEEVTVGQGKVIPSRQLQVVQNLEGGILEQIFVKEGQQVKMGQPLMRLDDTQFRSSFRENRNARENLQLMVARLRDEIHLVNTLSLEQLQQLKDYSVNTPQLDALAEMSPVAVAAERTVLASRITNLQAGLQVLIEQYAQAEAELNEQRASSDSLRQSYNLAKEEVALKRPLVEEQIVSKIEFLQDRRRLNDLSGQLKANRFAIDRARRQLEENLQKREELIAGFRAEALREQRLSQAELERLDESGVGLEDRVNRTLVTSPVHGAIQKINIATVGGVIQPGMNLVEIVPLDGHLQVEARIRPEDIAFIRPGLDAIVKLTAYDFAIYGGLAGKVVHVSPDTVVDPQGNSFYIARVETDQSYLGPESRPLPIIPGMLTSVDIITGKKSVLDYLLKPINRARESALRER
ncbi:MAG: HlyD family type I secretion periplasmic adaptor subunit [Marinobacterium sp.]|nr:HlyD family type I secretion periplasmic adaptor subunit [Marinobacterium sp.]